MARELVRPNPTWQKWAEWLGEDPKPGTICKDVIDMRAARRVWEGFQAIVGVAPEDARKYGTFHSWVNGNYSGRRGWPFAGRWMSTTMSCRSDGCSTAWRSLRASSRANAILLSFIP